jgi:RNA 2',3'-cyclic 3'-phosphodiesterase
MRIFIALDIPPEIRARMLEYAERTRPLAPEARWARTEGLHVTLKFIGETSDEHVAQIKKALAAVKAVPFAIKFAGAGFFPGAKSPRVFWIGVDGGEALSQLAARIDERVSKLGFPREERAYHPHLTLARTGSSPGSQHQLRPLASLLESEAPPQFGTMTAQEFFLYRSQPQKGGSKYTKLEKFALTEK